ncbi:MAG: putative CRISPR-associated protein [Chthonomonadales bacterium]
MQQNENRPRCVISTLGTSLLTNQAESDLQHLLRKTANLRREDYQEDDLRQVELRERQVRREILHASRDRVRAMSAELNGILALPGGYLSDLHYLLHTDTLQGELCAQIVKDWMAHAGYRHVHLTKLGDLRTASQEEFALGIDNLLHWCDQTLGDLRTNGYFIVFNLVGGFKSLQAYMQTIGMVYADEICYIFEGPGSPLLRIPRLPLRIVTTPLEKHAALVVRLACGENVPAGQVRRLPEAYVNIVDNGATLGEWGKLAWNQIRRDVLAGDLLSQPGLVYEESFKHAYQSISDSDTRVALQEALAKASTVWRKGGFTGLRADEELRYTDNAEHPKYGHFRIHDALWASCQPIARALWMRRIGSLDSVTREP